MNATVSVVGLGYVGLVSAVCLANEGRRVIGVECDQHKLAMIKRGICPIHENGLQELLTANRRLLEFTDDLKAAVRRSDIVLVAVGTPEGPGGKPDLRALENVACHIAAALNGYKVVAIKSTVPVGTCRRLKAMMEQCTTEDFDVVSNPEFLREGSAVHDFLYPDRVLVGADSQRAAQIMTDLHRTVRLPRIVRVESAELSKQAANGFLATKISYANMLAQLCEEAGADIAEVTQCMGDDKRIGHAFLHPGIGYGGSCLPKDVEGLAHTLEEYGQNAGLLQHVQSINRTQCARFVSKVDHILGGLSGKVLAVLGAAFKGGTDDTRYSPALAVISALCNRGAVARVFDPAVEQRAMPGVVWTAGVVEACAQADAVVILTDWPEFKRLDFAAIGAVLKQPVVIDGRNLYAPEAVEELGLEYHSVGRSKVGGEVAPVLVEPVGASAAAA